jgi:hypothetical protein
MNPRVYHFRFRIHRVRWFRLRTGVPATTTPLVYTNSLNRALCGLSLSGNADDDPAPRDEEGHFQMIVR